MRRDKGMLRLRRSSCRLGIEICSFGRIVEASRRIESVPI